MRVVISGAGGFIGSHLARALVKKNAEVHVILRKESSTRKISDVLGKVRIHRADIRDFSCLKRCIREISPEKIFHLAAFTNVERSPANIREAIDTNVMGTLNLLQAMESTDCSMLINTGTCEEYGQNRAPFRETQLPDPVSPYSASKTASVVFCNMYHRTYGYPITNLRPFLSYGPHQEENRFVPALILSALRGKDFETTGGIQTREMNFVTDIVEGYLLAAISPKAVGETINIGSGIQYSIREIAELINKLTGNRIKLLFGAKPYRDNEIWRLYCDNGKARKLLGWVPKIGLREGLKDTVAWYRSEKA